MVKNTAKNRDEIASVVSGNWGTKLHDLRDLYPDMSDALTAWCVKYLAYDKDARTCRLFGEIKHAMEFEKRMEKMVKEGK
jgi:hypothetical protein